MSYPLSILWLSEAHSPLRHRRGIFMSAVPVFTAVPVVDPVTEINP